MAALRSTSRRTIRPVSASPPARIRLVHWKAAEGPERSRRLDALGYAVDAEVPGTGIGIKQLREGPWRPS
jgi:hypothetical protein